MKNEMRCEITYLFWLTKITYLLWLRKTEENNIQLNQKRKVISLLISFVIGFNHLTVVKVLFCSLTKGITPKISKLCVCVLINNPSFKSFMCLDLLLEC